MKSQKEYTEPNIRQLILNSCPPLEWSNIENHPINELGRYFFGIGDGFYFNKESVNELMN